MVIAEKSAETVAQDVFILNGIMHVPHYSKRDVWVGPGFGRQHRTSRNVEQMLALGATPSTHPLWPRPGVKT